MEILGVPSSNIDVLEAACNTFRGILQNILLYMLGLGLLSNREDEQSRLWRGCHMLLMGAFVIAAFMDVYGLHSDLDSKQT